MTYITSDMLFQIAALTVAFLLLPLVTAWGLFLALRGIRKRLDRVIGLLESGSLQDQRTRSAGFSQEEKIKRALRNVHGAS